LENIPAGYILACIPPEELFDAANDFYWPKKYKTLLGELFISSTIESDGA